MKLSAQNGFSLTELLVVVAITGVVSTAIIGFFVSQQRSHTSQEQVTSIQGNVRAGLGVMSKELRMAGYNPTNQIITPMGFSSPGLNTITFTLDFHGQETDGIDNDGDGTDDEADEENPDGDANDANEQITYSINNTNTLLRLSSSTAVVPQPLADDIAAVAFAFAYDSDADGDLEPGYAIAGSNGLGPLNGTVNWFTVNANASTTNTGIAARAADIRAVKIWLLARTEADSQEYTNINTYIVGTQTISPTAANLHRRHLLLETVVRCRNMGLGL